MLDLTTWTDEQLVRYYVAEFRLVPYGSRPSRPEARAELLERGFTESDVDDVLDEYAIRWGQYNDTMSIQDSRERVLRWKAHRDSLVGRAVEAVNARRALRELRAQIARGQLALPLDVEGETP